MLKAGYRSEDPVSNREPERAVLVASVDVVNAVDTVVDTIVDATVDVDTTVVTCVTVVVFEGFNAT
jgi:hypothetical protein